MMKKAQAEIRQVLKRKKKVLESDIQELTYLKSVIKETLTLHPPASLLLPRESREPCRINGYEVPMGTKVIVNAFGAGRRMCPGISFGVANVELVLSQLLYHFNWYLPTEMTPENLDMTEAFGATVGRKLNLFLVAVPFTPVED